jgi:hypothetical protein
MICHVCRISVTFSFYVFCDVSHFFADFDAVRNILDYVLILGFGKSVRALLSSFFLFAVTTLFVIRLLFVSDFLVLSCPPCFSHQATVFTQLIQLLGVLSINDLVTPAGLMNNFRSRAHEFFGLIVLWTCR